MLYILLSYLHAPLISAAFCTFYLIWSSWWFLQWWPELHDMHILTCWCQESLSFSLLFMQLLRSSMAWEIPLPTLSGPALLPIFVSVFVREGNIGEVCQVIGMGSLWGQEKGRTYCYHRDIDLILCLLLNDFLSENQQPVKEGPVVSAMLEEKALA